MLVYTYTTRVYTYFAVVAEIKEMVVSLVVQLKASLITFTRLQFLCITVCSTIQIDVD